MKIEKLITEYDNYNDGESHRKIGRYWATDINSIKNKYLTPKTFFDLPSFNFYVSRMILSGIAMENMLTKIISKSDLVCEPQVSKVFCVSDDIDLVVKPDFVFSDKVWEVKYPFKLKKYDEIPERYTDQLECEFRVFNKPVFLGMFYNPFNVNFIEYVPSIDRWNNILSILERFHGELMFYDLFGKYEKHL